MKKLTNKKEVKGVKDDKPNKKESLKVIKGKGFASMSKKRRTEIASLGGLKVSKIPGHMSKIAQLPRKPRLIPAR